MLTSISLNVTATASATQITSSAPARPANAPDPAEIFQQLDADNKGYITATDIASAMVEISPEGAQLSAEDAQAMAKDMVQHMDSNGDGQVTQSEFEAAAPPDAGAQATTASSGTEGAKGGPPAGGGAAAGGASSSNETFDPADTNQDGTVSEPERQAYEAKHPTSQAAADSSATDKPGTGKTDRRSTEAVQTYQAVAETADA